MMSRHVALCRAFWTFSVHCDCVAEHGALSSKHKESKAMRVSAPPRAYGSQTAKSQAIVVPLCGYTPPAELEQFVVGFSM